MLLNTIEALIFAAGRGMTREEIFAALQFQYTIDEVSGAIDQLKEKYSGDSGIILIEYNNKFEFQSNPLYGEFLADTLMETRERAISSALLETLAIIAYNQPITKAKIEEIRGKNPDYAVYALLEHNLITVVGRKDNAVGRPQLFGTTDEFLRRFQLKELADLPSYEELLNAIANNYDRFYKNTEGLFRGKTLEDELLEERANKEAAAANQNEEIIIDEEELPDFLQGEAVVEVE